MDYTVLENSTLFRGVPAQELRTYLEETPHHIQCYDKEETISSDGNGIQNRYYPGRPCRSSEVLSKRKPDKCLYPYSG